MSHHPGLPQWFPQVKTNQPEVTERRVGSYV